MIHKYSLIKQYILITLITIIHTSIYYDPFTAPKQQYHNTVYGTGNKLKDIIYRSKCLILCNMTIYSDYDCCEGNSLDEMICLPKNECIRLKYYFQNYIIFITAFSYLGLILVTMLISFIVVYQYTIDTLFKYKNATCVSVVICCGALIIPMMILHLIRKYKGVTIEELFMADFGTLTIQKVLDGVEINESTIKRKPVQKRKDTRNNKINLIENINKSNSINSGELINNVSHNKTRNGDIHSIQEIENDFEKVDKPVIK